MRKLLLSLLGILALIAPQVPANADDLEPVSGTPYGFGVQGSCANGEPYVVVHNLEGVDYYIDGIKVPVEGEPGGTTVREFPGGLQGDIYAKAKPGWYIPGEENGNVMGTEARPYWVTLSPFYGMDECDASAMASGEVYTDPEGSTVTAPTLGLTVNKMMATSTIQCNQKVIAWDGGHYQSEWGDIDINFGARQYYNHCTGDGKFDTWTKDTPAYYYANSDIYDACGGFVEMRLNIGDWGKFNPRMWTVTCNQFRDDPTRNAQRTVSVYTRQNHSHPDRKAAFYWNFIDTGQDNKGHTRAATLE